jgi:cobalt-zinc-cadmium efflux system outer membrane protein
MRILERIGLILCAVGVSAQAQEKEWTEQAVLQLFLNQNPISRETRARFAVAESETQGRTLWANPTIGFSREGAGRTEFYQASQTLAINGRLPLLRQAGAIQAEVVNAEGGFSLWLARCALRSAFYRTLANQERQHVWAEADADLAGVIALLKERESEGEGSKLDRLRAERERLELAASASSVEAELVISRGELLAFLPAPDAPARLSGHLASAGPKESVAEWVQRALANRLDIQAERRRVEQYRKEQQAADRLRVPEPVVNAGLKRADLGMARIDSGPVVGVSWALPLFNKGKTEVARWSAEQERTAARLEQMTRKVQASVEGAFSAFQIHRESYQRYRQAQEHSTKEMVDIAKLAYQEGEIGILQLLDAYRLRRDGRLREIDLAWLAKQAQIALETQIGEELPQ